MNYDKTTQGTKRKLTENRNICKAPKEGRQNEYEVQRKHHKQEEQLQKEKKETTQQRKTIHTQKEKMSYMTTRGK